ncbi:MAG: type IV secretory system conjugative DNA transfer family protein [Rhodanobacter sp.]
MPVINSAPPPDLQALLSDQGRAAIVSQSHNANSPRLQALRDSAIQYGVQGGMAHRSYEINAVVGKEANQLDGVYDFNALLLDHNVVPPVLTGAATSLQVTDGNAIRLSDATYSIVLQAHFATVAPNWRDYLRPTAVYLAVPPPATLMPKNAEETTAWKQYVAQGWTVGIQQANAVFAQSLARLKRDFSGMVLYRRLLAQHMVSLPYVGQADLGITGNGQSMAINDRVLRITATPQLNTHSATWTPLPVPSGTPTPMDTTPATDASDLASPTETFPVKDP